MNKEKLIKKSEKGLKRLIKKQIKILTERLKEDILYHVKKGERFADCVKHYDDRMRDEVIDAVIKVLESKGFKVTDYRNEKYFEWRISYFKIEWEEENV